MNPCYASRSRNLLFAIPFGIVFPFMASASTATWLGGTGNWTDATKWSTGVVPDETTDVVIDGNEQSTSKVTLASYTGTYSAWSVLIDSDDSLVVKRSQSTSQSTISLGMSSMTNYGTIEQGNDGNRNNCRCYVTSSNAFYNAKGAIYKLTGYGSYKGCYTGLTIPVDGSVNDGTIFVRQPLSQSNTSSLSLSGFGRFVNNGTITFKATGSGDGGYAYLRFGYAQTAGASSCIDGTGEIILDKEETAVVYNNVRLEGVKYNDANRSTHTITNGPAHTIRGTGFIHECAIVNAGLVRAEGTNGLLYVENSDLTHGGKPIRNLSTGRMVACGGTGITIGATGTANAQFSNEGLLEARSGGHIEFRTSLTTSNNKNTNPTTTALDLSGILAGAGTFGGKPLRLLDDATLSPGDLSNTDGTGTSTAGTLTFATNLVLSTGTTLDFQFGRLDAGEYDSVVVEGSLTLAGTLRISALNGIRPSGTYRIFTCNPAELTGDAASVVLDVAQGMAAPVLLVDAVAGTVDAFFPPPETVILIR